MLAFPIVVLFNKRHKTVFFGLFDLGERVITVELVFDLIGEVWSGERVKHLVLLLRLLVRFRL